MVRVARNLSRKSLALLTSLLLVMFWVPGLLATPASAATQAGFEIDGNVAPSTALDWTSPDVTSSPDFALSHDNPNDTTSFGANSKEEDAPSSWGNSGSPPGKADVADVYTYAHNSGGHAYFDFAWTRLSPSGTDGYYIELNKKPNLSHSVSGVVTTYPDRSVGDVRFLINEQGNSPLSLNGVFTWSGTAWTSVAGPYNGFDIGVSTGNVTPPSSPTYGADEFVEVSLDLTALVGVSPGCPGQFGFVNFRSYTGGSDKNLEDYVKGFPAPAGSTCSALTIVKKTADASHTLLGGATFRITPNPLPGGSGSFLDVTDNTTANDNADAHDADGSVGTILINPALPSATGYTIVERTAPVGYLLGTATVPGPYVAPSGGAATPVTFYDPLGSIAFEKTDAGTGDHIGFATFHVVGTAGAALTRGYDKSVTDNKTTGLAGNEVPDTNPAVGYIGVGTVNAGTVYTGTYSVTETGPPAGYDLPAAGAGSRTLSVTVSDAHPAGAWAGSDNVFNDPRSPVTLTIRKTDTSKPAVRLAGASFSLYQVVPGGADTLVGSCVTGDGLGGSVLGECSVQAEWGHSYYWVETQAPHGYNLPEPDRTDPFAVTKNDVANGVLQIMADGTTAITTSATASVTVGGTIKDTATISGLRSDSTGSVTFSVYGPFAPNATISANSCVNPVQGGAAGNRIDSFSVPVVAGTSVYASDAAGHVVTPAHAGKYAWVASYSGDTKTAAATGTCGDQGESSTVNQQQPQLVTTASDAHTVDGNISDSADLSDFFGSVTGQILHFAVYTNNTCTGTAYATRDVAMDANGDASSGDVAVDGIHDTFYWKVTYDGQGDNLGVVEACGAVDAHSNEISHAPLIPTPTKSPASGTVKVYAPDNTITYTVTVQNTGKAAANGVSVTDPIDAGATFTSNDSCTGNGVSNCTFAQPAGVPTWTLDLAAGGTATIQFTVTANATDTDGQHILNTATVHSGAFHIDTNQTDHTVIRPILSLDKLANPLPVEDDPANGSVAPGQTITYALPLTNDGSDAANGVVVTDQVPPHTSYNAAAPAHCENHTTHANLACAAGHSGASPDVVTWTVDVPAKTTVDVVFSVIVADKAALTNGDSIPNQGHFTWTYSDVSNGPNLTGDSRQIHHVVKFPVLTQVKTAIPAPRDINGNGGVVQLGGTIHYVVTVHNGGQAEATGVTVTDTIPSGSTYVANSASPAATLTNGVLSWTVSVAAGQDTQVSFNVKVNAGDADGFLINNTAKVNGVDTNTTTHIVEFPIMSVAKSSDPVSGSAQSPTLVAPNTKITYTLTVTNAGRQDAAGFVVTDAVPAGTTYNGDASCGGAANCTVDTSGLPSIKWTLTVPGGSVANNVVTPTTRKLTFSVTTPDVQSKLIDNTATFTNVHTPGCVVTEANTCDTTTTHHEVVFPVINAHKTSSPASGTAGNPATVTPGQVITYTIAVDNSGQADASGVHINDVVPSGVTFVAGSADASGGTYDAGSNSVSWTINVAHGATTLLTFQAKVPDDATNGTLINNTATFSNVHTPNCLTAGEGTCSTETTHHEVRFAVLTLAKSSNPVSGSVVQRGDRIDYTVTLTNTGLAAAQKTITDTLPDHVTLVGGSAVPDFTSVNGNVVTWDVNVPAATTDGESTTPGTVVLTYSVTVDKDAPEGSTLTNVALVNGDCVGNDDASACTTDHHVPTGALTLVKHVNKTTASYGDQLIYTFDARTTGALDQTSVVVTDVLPKGTAYVANSAGCTDAGTCTTGFSSGSSTVTWHLGDMAAGTTRHLVFKVTIVKPSFDPTVGLPPATIVNFGNIASTETPKTPSNKVVTKVVTVLGVKVVRPPKLPFTGAPAQEMLLAGLGLLGAGIILTSVRRRREQ